MKKMTCGFIILKLMNGAAYKEKNLLVKN